MSIRNTIFAAFAVLGGVNAQFGSATVSAECKASLTTLALGPASVCLGTPGLITIMTTPANESLIQPIDSWLMSTCAQPACTNETITQTVTNITTGCATDLAQAGVTTGTATDISAYIEEWYPTAREIACLKDSSNALCVTTILTNLQTQLGVPLSQEGINSAIPKIMADPSTFAPANISCTPCTQAAYSVLRSKLDDSNRGSWDTFWGAQCGQTFLSGSIPASVTPSANKGEPIGVGSASSTTTNSAGSSFASLAASGMGLAVGLVGAVWVSVM